MRMTHGLLDALLQWERFAFQAHTRARLRGKSGKNKITKVHKKHLTFSSPRKKAWRSQSRPQPCVDRSSGHLLPGVKGEAKAEDTEKLQESVEKAVIP